jgi:hypothetical protein
MTPGDGHRPRQAGTKSTLSQHSLWIKTGVAWFIDLAPRTIIPTAITGRRNGIFAPHFAEKYRFVFGQTRPAMLTILALTSDDSIESTTEK